MTVALESPIVWGHRKINGKLTSSCDAGKHRLYVCERFGGMEAWVDSVKIGNFASMNAAKAAAERAVGLRVARPVIARQSAGTLSDKLQPTARAYVTDNPPPVADLSKPATIEIPVQVKPVHFKATTPDQVALEGHCKCGARLGRSGQCPALCEPVPAPPPVYTGPLKVGRTHIGRMAQPVDGWVR